MKGGRDREQVEAALLDHVRARLQAEIVQRLGGRLQHVDLVGREGVAGVVDPVRAVHGMEGEAHLLAARGPVGTRGDAFAAHGQLPDECRPAVAPKPPRVTCTELIAWEPGRAPVPVPAVETPYQGP